MEDTARRSLTWARSCLAFLQFGINRSRAFIASIWRWYTRSMPYFLSHTSTGTLTFSKFTPGPPFKVFGIRSLNFMNRLKELWTQKKYIIDLLFPGTITVWLTLTCFTIISSPPPIPLAYQSGKTVTVPVTISLSLPARSVTVNDLRCRDINVYKV